MVATGGALVHTEGGGPSNLVSAKTQLRGRVAVLALERGSATWTPCSMGAFPGPGNPKHPARHCQPANDGNGWLQVSRAAKSDILRLGHDVRTGSSAELLSSLTRTYTKAG